MDKQTRLENDGAVNPILFYNEPGDSFGIFSNFSRHSLELPHPFTAEMTIYLTGEHRYQAMKADNADDHDYVLEVDNPGAAKLRGQHVTLREGWGNNAYDLCWYVMVETVYTKTVQN